MKNHQAIIPMSEYLELTAKASRVAKVEADANLAIRELVVYAATNPTVIAGMTTADFVIETKHFRFQLSDGYREFYYTRIKE